MEGANNNDHEEKNGTRVTRRAKRLSAQSGKTHPTIQAKQNQMYLITTLTPAPVEQALINKMLPKELILRIFSYLDIISLCRSAQACHLWNVLALDGSNWQEVDLFDFQRDVKPIVVENLARRCGGFLKQLSLKGCENVQDSALRSFTAKCANIEHLSLYKCKRVTDASCENLGKHCHKLRHLNLENCSAITDRAMKYIGEGCPLLTYLNISWCDNVQDRGVQHLLTHCPNLETLILRGCEGLTEQVFAPVVGNMGNLVKLNMLSCFVNDDTVKNISEGCPKLEYLCLSNCSQITDRSLNHLAAGCKNLTVLELSGCVLLSDGGFVQLARACKKLERLDLEDCSLITDTTINSLSVNCSNLCQLSLSHCELITDESVHVLSEHNREKLQVLELDNCPMLTDSALSHLRHVRSLRRIALYDCQNISKEAINRYKHQRPHVEIQAYFAPVTPPTNPVTNRAGVCRCCAIL
ncbi:hypothetical protein WR25_11835 isoform A [Diploscapter pachys]|uniref:F-box domain-containing protein n=1 Tax=Diploscapter pachys TaxID=2018661 RepID=A0A2A2KLR3_9BILA|nr:hypothetical protein WR25_11835 isoform A [Diploscapter pachys]